MGSRSGAQALWTNFSKIGMTRFLIKIAPCGFKKQKARKKWLRLGLLDKK